MALIDDFKSRFPLFDTASVDAIFPIIEPIYPAYYGGSVDVAIEKEAIFNLLAHMFVSEQSTSNSGGQLQSSKAVGSVSASYEATTSSGQASDFFKTTKYGQRFLQIISTNMGAVFV